jgi:putative FmdB family regulatory protein
MPTYPYKCECGHQFEWQSKIIDREIPLSEPCPSCGVIGKIQRIITTVGFGDPVRMGFMKPDSGMKEALQRIHEKTPGSQLDKNSTIVKL